MLHIITYKFINDVALISFGLAFVNFRLSARFEVIESLSSFLEAK